jgi:DNA-binding HxlR family transcriptional regulator
MGVAELKKEKKKKREKKVESSAFPEEVSAGPFEEAVESMEALRKASEELGGKWRLRVLWSLRDGAGLRYGGIKNSIPGITDMMLSQCLRELCQSGFVERQQFQEIPPRVEYHILQDGEELLPLLQWVIQWQQKRGQRTACAEPTVETN